MQKRHKGCGFISVRGVIYECRVLSATQVLILSRTQHQTHNHMEFSSTVLSIETSGPVATLWLDRPEKRNAMGSAIWVDLPHAMAILDADPEIRAVVLAARGKAFTVGLDLGEMGHVLMPSEGSSPARQQMDLHQQIKMMQAAMTSVAACRKPVIAAVHGYCIGAGMDLITACNIRLASADASFSVRETRMAIVADLGTLQRLPRIIPAGHAQEMIFTGRDYSAAEAAAAGLVNTVYPDEEALHAAAAALAADIARNSPLAVQGAKYILDHGADLTIDQSLELVALWNTGFLRSNDLAEAVNAFFQKRPPAFTGE